MVRDMVDAVDDGDGFIDYEEFKKMIMKYQYKHFKCKSLKINIDIVMPSSFMQFQINMGGQELVVMIAQESQNFKWALELLLV